MSGLTVTVVANERLDVLKNISAAGAPVLTLRMLDRAQPKVDVDLYEWILWEQERYAILSRWQQWNELLVRIEGLPADLPEQFNQQATTYKARAYLEIGQTDTARRILRAQLWQTGVGAVSEYQTWRRQIIVSYLKDGRIDDARIAMLRFNQDFDTDDESWLLLRASVLIQAGRYEEAIQILQGLESWQARLTSLLAQFRAQRISATELWSQVKSKAGEGELEDAELATLWALGYYAAQQMSAVDRVVALENLFQIDGRSPIELFQLHADRLWRAYIEYAELVGNRAELLVGDDARWLDLAQKTSAVTPIKSRSLLALIMVKSADPAMVNSAAKSYLQTFGDTDTAERNLLGQLFNNSEVYADADRIPVIIKYQLVDLALIRADIDEATRLMSGMNTYPEGTSRFSWQLRHARVLILGGRYEEGNQILQALLAEYQQPNAEDTDRILQVLFDMQTVNLNEQAIAHFNQLLRVSIEAKQHREILFWIADSYKALKKYDQAALLYLRSAMLPGTLAMDPWAQTARFNAADSLQKSGLVDDARRIYTELLRVTKEPASRAMLKHNIQQLWLNQNIQ
ncbi:MAG: tetratricopeptide repeat protein [Proteobacteria bacterium]|nr:tetratricopeptide repeat protein [Pseudomonadota bacterium]